MITPRTCASFASVATIALSLKGRGSCSASSSGLCCGAPRPKQQSLLRAKPSKGGDAELRDYSDVRRHVRRAASDSTSGSNLAAFFLEERMPFTFKLSQRLARMRLPQFVAPAVALAIAAFVACNVPTRPKVDQASQIALSPRSLSISSWKRNRICDRPNWDVNRNDGSAINGRRIENDLHRRRKRGDRGEWC